MPVPLPEEFADLQKISARIGADPLLIQGAGGNTSIKQGDVMWIKASGTLLGDAGTSDIFVPVDLAGMRQALREGSPQADQPGHFLIPGGSNLRPSIETSLHAVFAQKVVIHAHCVHTLAHVVRADRLKLLQKRLKEHNWALVAYHKPGANLARVVADALTPDIDVMFLGNHGVIVAAQTVAAAHGVLNDVHKKLAIAPGAPASPELHQLDTLARDSAYEQPQNPALHQLALEPARLQQATGGSLYPDHVIFCGIGATALRPGEGPDQAAARITASGAPAPVFLLVPGAGILLRKGLSHGALALTTCLADVLSRVPPDAKLLYLTQAQNMELLDWDAEKYRATLDAG